MNEEEKFLAERGLTIDDYYTMNDNRPDNSIKNLVELGKIGIASRHKGKVIKSQYIGR